MDSVNVQYCIVWEPGLDGHQYNKMLSCLSFSNQNHLNQQRVFLKVIYAQINVINGLCNQSKIYQQQLFLSALPARAPFLKLSSDSLLLEVHEPPLTQILQLQ